MSPKDISVVFMGTPEFSAVCLRKLKDAGYNVILSVSQPDKPVGRKHIITPPPAKVEATELGIEVFQPDSMKSDEAFEKISSLSPDLIVTAAYGKILPQRVLDIPRFGCLNVHASVLPAYRGAAPVQYAILNGDAKTGVTIMKMDAGMDTGDIISVCEVDIDPLIHTDELMAKLACEGASLLIDTIPGYMSGEKVPVPQDEDKATSCPPIRPEQAEFTWDQDAWTIHNKVRALSTWPGAYVIRDGKKLKIYDSEVIGADDAPEGFEDCPAGTIVKAHKKDLIVMTGNGLLKINELQNEGGKRLKAVDCAHNYKAGDLI